MNGKGWEIDGIEFDAIALVREGVQYKRQLYPREIVARCSREDGLRLTLLVRVDEDRGPFPARATLTGPDGLGTVDRVPLHKLARLVAGMVEIRHDDTRPGTWKMRDPNVDELQVVADAYRAAVRDGNPVTRSVHAALEAAGVYRAEGTVSKLIHKARRTEGPDGETYLPPTEPGRKRA